MDVIIPASGTGSRFGGEIPKQFTKIGDKPILWLTLYAFQEHPNVREIITAVPVEYVKTVYEYGFEKVRVVPGSSSRAESIYNALMEVERNSVILIHDGVRPFVCGELITKVAQAAFDFGAAIAAIPVTDTIKQVSGGKITATLDRSVLWQAQTPQGFRSEIIIEAYEQAKRDNALATATDDSALVERLGIKVHIVEGSASNIKITTTADLGK